MAAAPAPRGQRLPSADAARSHFILRFSVATAGVFTICEYMAWQPSALAPVLAGLLLANLTAAPPFKVGFSLVVVMGLSAGLAFALTSLLGETPHILFLVLAMILFLAFATLAQSKGQLPLTLLLINIAVLPVIGLIYPQLAGRMAQIFVRAMALAVLALWIAFALWPIPSPKAPEPPAPPLEYPVAAAAIGTAIVLPLMLVFLLLGLTDAMPVLLTTVLIVAKMEEERGAASAWAKLLGNFLGGFIAVAAYYLLQIAPTLPVLFLITFIIGAAFAHQIAKGGVRGGNALLAYNATMVIFGLALLKGPENSGTWAARLVQFAIACTFAVGMMALLWPRKTPRRAALQGG
jgi:hypothetical protein